MKPALVSRRHLLTTGTAFAATRLLSAVPSATRKAAIIGHTGAGDYGHGIEKIFQGMPDVSVVAVADPAESWSVARYVREADACVQDILRRGKRPVLVGGTGLYLDALVRGQDFAAGSQGGEVMAAGTPEEVMANPKSLTGQYLRGEKFIPVPLKRRKGSGKKLKLTGAAENNLKNISVEFPLSEFVVVTGVSGSGKSTLVNQILKRVLAQKLNHNSAKPGKYDKLTGWKNIEKVIDIDQSPIGRTPRSNPATYTSVFDDIRTLFAQTNEAKMRGYTKARFSFNVKGGRCEACEGDGVLKIEMHFLPDVYVPCDVCKGKRYNRETLEVKYKGKNIHEILEMTVEDARAFFDPVPAVARKLQTLMDVGLSYIRLGQSATTLSGGEAQRVKLARELSKRDTGQTLYILDEPTTGLHFHDIQQLLKVLHQLRDRGNTIVIIEHNLDVIKTADWIVDLGPEGGAGGGRILVTGTPEEMSRCKESHTARFLAPLLEK